MSDSKGSKKISLKKNVLIDSSVKSSLISKEEHTQFKDKNRVTVSDDKHRVTPESEIKTPDNILPTEKKKKSNAVKFYKENIAATSDINANNDVCQIDTHKSDSTLQALEHIRDMAQDDLNQITHQIEELNDNFTNTVQPRMDERSLRNTFTSNKIKLERHAEIITDEKSGEQRKVIRYRPVVVSEQISRSQKEKQHYRVLSHRNGSNKVSAFFQETGQLADIVNHRGLIHGAFAIKDKFSVDTSADSNTGVHTAKTVAKAALLSTETTAVELINTSTDNAVNAVIRKVKTDIDNEDNDGTKAVKLAATIGADILSDANTIRKHVSEDKYKRRERANDFDKEEYDFNSERLEFKRQKTEFELKQAQRRITDYKDKTDGVSSDSKLHSEKRLENKEKSTIGLENKSTVAPTSEKARAETLTDNQQPIGLYEKRVEKKKAKKAMAEEMAQPHKYVLKIRKSVNSETGRVQPSVRIERKDLSVAEKNNGLVRNTKRNFHRLANGEITLRNSTKRDPNMLQELAEKNFDKLSSRGLNKVKEKAVSDGSDNDTVRAIDGTARVLIGTGKAYDTAKSTALIVRDEARSMLQPVSERVQASVISAEHKILERTSEHRTSMLQPHSEYKKPKSTYDSGFDTKKKHKLYDDNRKKVFQVFKDKEVKQQFLKEITKRATDEVKKVAVGGAVIFLMILMLPILLMGAGGTGAGATIPIISVVSPTEDLDLTKCETYWTELAQNLVKEHKEFVSKHGDGNKFNLASDAVKKLNHDTYKMLAYLSVKSPKKKEMWDFDSAKSEIESIFNDQYEFFSGLSEKTVYEIHTVEREYISDTYAFKGSQWEYSRNDEMNNIYVHYFSRDYEEQAKVWYEVSVYEWDEYDLINDVYIDNGEKLNDPESRWKLHHHRLSLLFPDNPPTIEQWKHVYQEEELIPMTYKTYEYGIKEKKSFDDIINERVNALDEKQKENYEMYLNYYLGHYSFSSPVQPFNITDHAGYNTDVDGSDGLDNSMTVQANNGQEIKAPCDGVLTKTGDHSCSIKNSANKYVMSFDNINLDVSDGNIKKKTVIGSAASGDGIKISLVDDKGNELNPYIYIDWR